MEGDIKGVIAVYMLVLKSEGSFPILLGFFELPTMALFVKGAL